MWGHHDAQAHQRQGKTKKPPSWLRRRLVHLGACSAKERKGALLFAFQLGCWLGFEIGRVLFCGSLSHDGSRQTAKVTVGFCSAVVWKSSTKKWRFFLCFALVLVRSFFFFLLLLIRCCTPRYKSLGANAIGLTASAFGALFLPFFRVWPSQPTREKRSIEKED